MSIPSTPDRVPKVRLAKPGKRPWQLRYTDATTGKEVRISTGTHDEPEALREKAKLEARLLLGVESRPKKKSYGEHMLWDVFRDEYHTLHLATLSNNAASDAESRLDIATPSRS